MLLGGEDRAEGCKGVRAKGPNSESVIGSDRVELVETASVDEDARIVNQRGLGGEELSPDSLSADGVNPHRRHGRLAPFGSDTPAFGGGVWVGCETKMGPRPEIIQGQSRARFGDSRYGRYDG